MYFPCSLSHQGPARRLGLLMQGVTIFIITYLQDFILETFRLKFTFPDVLLQCYKFIGA